MPYQWQAVVSRNGVDTDKKTVLFETDNLLSAEHLAEKAGHAATHLEGIERRFVWSIKLVEGGTAMPAPSITELALPMPVPSSEEVKAPPLVLSEELQTQNVFEQGVKDKLERLENLLAANYGVVMSIRSKADDIQKRLDTIERKLALQPDDT